MSSARDDLRTWSRRQWSTVVFLVTLLQVGLVFVLNERRGAVEVREATVRGFRLSHWQPTTAEGEMVLAAIDPTVFALPGPRGFSGQAWRQTWSLPSMGRGWTDEVRWLPGETGWFGRLEGLSDVAIEAVGDSEIRPDPSSSEVVVGPLPLAQRSALELDDGLTRRGLAREVLVPSMTHSNLLGVTEVQVSVEPDGHVFSAVVLRGSGLGTADERAVAIALGCRFKPTSDEVGPTTERQWGRLRFRWYTVAPGAAAGDAGGGSS